MVKTHLGQEQLFFQHWLNRKEKSNSKIITTTEGVPKRHHHKEVKASDPKIQKFPQVYQVLVVECITHVASRYGICSYMYGLFLW